MKFAQHLSAHITPEWRKQYINYEEMKVMLYDAVNGQPIYSDSTQSHEELEKLLVDYKKDFEKEFFAYCQKELEKINTFFAEKLAESQRKFATLKTELNLSLTRERKSLKSSSFSSSRKRLPTQASEIPQKDDKFLGGFIGGFRSPFVVAAASAAARATASTYTRQFHKHEEKQDVRKMHALKLAFSEFYLSLVLLQNYQNLNFTGFRKILKKHDKLLGTDSGAKWRIKHVEHAPFFTNKEVDKLISETENVFTDQLEHGDRGRAMKRLRVPPLNAQQSVWVTFRIGFYLGAFLVLLIAVLLTGIFRRSLGINENSIEWTTVLRLFRGPLLLIVFLFLIGINVYGWRTSGVNHVLIFELDPRDNLSEQHIIEIAAFFAVLWSVFLLGYLFSDALSMSSWIFPLILYGIMILYFINPTKTFKHSSRFWLLKVLGRVVRAPFVHVAFADFWLADQLNSLVPIILDFEFTIVYYLRYFKIWDPDTDVEKDYLIRTIVACLPAWFRFAQCIRRYKDDKSETRGIFPHLVNAGKYSTTYFVVIFSSLTKYTDKQYTNSLENPFFVFWIISLLISSCYTYLWDIKMDWGLFEKQKKGDSEDTKEYMFLRDEIVYSSPNYYYGAIIGDLILRFAWTLSVSLFEIGLIRDDLMVSTLASIELFRRFVWNFFRLENEHLNNCGEFRAVRDISVAPLVSDKKYENHANGEASRKSNRLEIEMNSKKAPPRAMSMSYIPVQKSEIRLLIEDHSNQTIKDDESTIQF